MNLAGLRAEVDRRTGVAVDPAALTGMVNQSLAALAAEYDWPWNHATATITTTPGMNAYPLPAGWVRVRSVAHRGVTLPSAGVRDMEGGPRAGGARFTWTVEGGQLLLVPTPTGVHDLTVRYLAGEPPLVDDGDEAVVPDRFVGAVTSHAAYLVALRERDAKAAALFLDDYRAWLARMRDDVRSRTGPFRIRVRPGYEGP